MLIGKVSLYNPTLPALNKKTSTKELKSFCCKSFKNVSYPKNYYLNQISFRGKKADFNTVDEANEYFFKKYGAIADFSSIEQAETVNSVIKDFLSKTKTEDKKILKDVLVTPSATDDNSCVKIAANVKYGYNLEDKMLELYQAYQKAGRIKEFIDVFHPEAVKCTVLRLGLILNDDVDWGENNLENNKEEIQDKLVTLIHLKHSPFDYVIKNSSRPNKEESRIMKEVIDDKNASKNDFIEHYVFKRLSGEIFSPEVTKLYREFGGANLFSDWVDYDFAGVQFKSLDEAKKYFKDEYGIKANFTDLEQAYAVKMAIDDFLKLETIKDKKFLKGIEIEIKDELGSENPDVNAQVELSDYECIYNDDISALFEKYQLEGRENDFFEENEPDKINVNKIVLCLKSDFGWEAKPKGKSYMGDKTREIIQHEIGHILHLKNNPWQFFKNKHKKALTRPEYETMKQVSNYAVTDKLEFVAEYISNRMQGKTFDNNAVKLYKSLGGPNLFYDW